MRRVLLLAVAAAGLASPAASQAPDSSAAVQRPSGRAPRASWTSDKRLYRPGDVISVIVDEFTLIAAGAGDRVIDRRDSDGLFFLLPSTRLGANIRGRDDSDNRGSATRDDRLRTEISVRVVEVDRTGGLRLEGHKKVAVDKHEQEFVLRGWVRPEDVSPHNVVDAWRIGDLELLYASNGELKKPKKGLLSRLLSVLF